MYIADLHIHSKYSRATSRDCDLPHLDYWARRKGIDLVGTGDFTHPAWREELSEHLVEAEQGLYRLKDKFVLEDETTCHSNSPRFVITGEISSIYKKQGKVRKVHNLILLPSLEDAQTLAHKLEAIGNIHSDGRPILGIDSRDLLEITLESCPDAVFIPAHIWTPHFSMFGAFSGFDTITECFGDLTPYIHAVETGLSSDPPMNWRVPMLDSCTLISNSDAHSPSKLGREATLLNIGLSYPELKAAIEGTNPSGVAGTIEFFPEEGKYHLDGHRNCGLCLNPAETELYGGKCPKCGKKITIGVEHRVEQLATRPEGYQLKTAKPFESLVPLPEVIASSTGYTTASKKVTLQYESMLKNIGNEFFILRQAPLEEIGSISGPCIQEGIRRLRAGEVSKLPGYDGKYGVIQLLSLSEIEKFSGQTSLFGFSSSQPVKKKTPLESPKKSLQHDYCVTPAEESCKVQPERRGLLESLNENQREAVCTARNSVAVIAGPGTGKTKTLIARICYLIDQKGVSPAQITAVTFTKKAAAEMRQRLEQQLSSKQAAKAVHIGTFHAICLEFLQQKYSSIRLLEEYEATHLAQELLKEQGQTGSPAKLLQEVSRMKNGTVNKEQEFSYPKGLLERYCSLQKEKQVLDFDDLLLDTLHAWQTGDFSSEWGSRFTYLLVDEFQDSSPLQYQLIRAWTQNNSNLFVIGDPDQSIYGFRGASAECFSNLEQEYPQLQTIYLTENYRSTPQVLGCALPVISHNQGAERKLSAHVPDGVPVRIMKAESPLSEAIFIAKEIARMTGGMDMLSAREILLDGTEGKQRDFSDISILYRTHRQADLLEKCLKQEGIPYVVAGRDDFLSASSVRGALNFFRFLLHPEDTFSLTVCLQLVFDCPVDLCEAIAKSWDHFQEIPLLQRLEHLKTAWESSGHLLPFFSAVESYFSKISDKPRKLLDSYADQYHLNRDDSFTRLRGASVFHPTMEEFLQTMAFGEESDILRGPEKSYKAGAVTLMTLHGSKGLEFPVVFLCGVNQGTLPYESEYRKADPAEERRLFFVGMTRAKEELILSTFQQPSIFLEEIPSQYCTMEQAAKPKEDPVPVQLSLF